MAALAPLLLTIAGGVLYHVAAKSVPRDLDPAFALVAAYGLALVLSAAAGLAMAPTPLVDRPIRFLHPAVLLVGLAAVMIEMGYLLAYRAAWPVGVASILANGLVAVCLVPLGVMLFGERITPVSLLGVAMCLGGLALLRR